MAEAIQLAKEDLVKQLTDETWRVSSLNGENNYKVQVADSVHAYDLYCECKGWIFKRGTKDCKHCEAVRQVDNGQNVPTKKTITKSSRSKLKTSNPYLKKTTTKSSTPSKKSIKNIKVTCWHCGNKDQKILSLEEAFKCDKCHDQLWTGDGGFEEIKVGVWK